MVGQEEMILVALTADADVTIGIQDSVHGEDVVRKDQFIDLGSVVGKNAHAQHDG
jgi:hypothetical protein